MLLLDVTYLLMPISHSQVVRLSHRRPSMRRMLRTLTRWVLMTCAVSRKENVASAALQAALSWWALDALQVVVASTPNRAWLVEAGALPALAAVLKAALSRLHSMSAVLGGALPFCAHAPWPRPDATASA